MAVRTKYNWTQIQNTCPEFLANQWDIVLAVIAAVGIILNFFLIGRFKTELKGSVFLFTLAFLDMVVCLLYVYNYLFKSLALFFQNEMMADIRMRMMTEVKMIEEFGNVFIPLLVFFIVVEKFLWTCSCRIRHNFRLFTMATYKCVLTAVTAVYATLAVMILTWNLLIAEAHFCDVLLLALPWRHVVPRFFQRVLIPMVSMILAPTTFLLALLTLCRISRVGKELNHEEINLANIGSETPKLTTGKIKRSILCMLAIYFSFMVKDFCWYVYVNPRTTSIFTEKRNSRIRPCPLPFFGNMLEMFSYPPPVSTAFSAWAKKYGNIYTIWMGDEPTIIIGGYKELKETFINDADSYSDKMIYKKFNDSLRGGDHGVIDTNGNTWKEHRRFTLHTLRDFGMGKEVMESSILLEVDKMEEELKKMNGKNVDVQELFDIAIGNIINQFLFGHRFNDPEKFSQLKRLLDLFFEVQGSLRVYAAYLINWIPQCMVDFMTPDVCEVRDGVFHFFKEKIDEHREEIDFEEAESKDYVETYLKEQRRREAAGDKQSFSDNQLRSMCFDIWVAGMHTTTNTIGFLTSLAVNNMEAQRKMQNELSQVVGDRIVTMKDKVNLPYTNAFINEAQRRSNLLPINLPHATTRDVELVGCVIPKGTAVVHQISSVLCDPTVFPNPENFKPERFLDESGALKKVEELIPFSVGKRVCLGEGLARMELFLFTANLFNQFEFSEGSEGLPSLEKSYAFISKAKNYTCRVTPRNW
uniref:Uncharacterized protein n=1 Tax=Caenorhabditis japonica TaxID=281687 RepID=A0A8R1DWW1_CAEJA